MIVGRGQLSQSFLDTELLLPIHHSIVNNKETVERLSKDIQIMAKTAKDNIQYYRLGQIHITN